ncbi:ORF-3 [Teiidae poxvirus 1]|nr:ORF-3 [Teiidae poxvirus 1]
MDSFSTRLITTIYKSGQGFCVSTNSLRSVLSNLLLGCSGEAKEELANLLKGCDCECDCDCGINQDVQTSSVSEGTLMLTRNGYIIKKDFINKSKQRFKTRIVGFSDPHKATEVAKDWVLTATKGMIKNMVLNIEESTKLVLLNAIYFLSRWKHPFNPCCTHDGRFTKYDKTVVTVKMMVNSGNYAIRHDSTLQATVLQLCYVDDSLSMFVIIPDAVTGIDRIIKELCNLSLDPCLFTHKYIELFLPKFEVENESKLNDSLKELKCRGIFMPGGLLNISDDPNLLVSDIQQKTVVKVSEEGTEAASATAILMSDGVAFLPKVKADKPFLCVIMHKEYQTPLFVVAFCG